MRSTVLASFILVTALGWVVSEGFKSQTRAEAFAHICELVAKKYMVASPTLRDWSKQCVQAARRSAMFVSQSDYLQRIHGTLASLEVSHLDIYSPAVDRRMWQGQDVDTGIRVRGMDGRFVVVNVISASAGEIAGVKLGDEVISINGEPIMDSWQIQKAKGFVAIQRKDKTIDIEIEPFALQIDGSPELLPLTGGFGLLRISSFRPEYFAKGSWQQLTKKLGSSDHLIVDLRGNNGGNFVSMLRALSPFFCEPTKVGEIVQPRKIGSQTVTLEDDLDDMKQLDALAAYKKIEMLTFEDYGCYRGPMTVLVDSDSASVTEIFAEAIRASKRGRVWGRGTAGDVVLGVWYELPLLGRGYRMSIPEAQVLNLQGESLEATGVWPEQWLSYDLNEALRGEDSWLLRVKNYWQR